MYITEENICKQILSQLDRQMASNIGRLLLNYNVVKLYCVCLFTALTTDTVFGSWSCFAPNLHNILSNDQRKRSAASFQWSICHDGTRERYICNGIQKINHSVWINIQIYESFKAIVTWRHLNLLCLVDIKDRSIKPYPPGLLYWNWSTILFYANASEAKLADGGKWIRAQIWSLSCLQIARHQKQF